MRWGIVGLIPRAIGIPAQRAAFRDAFVLISRRIDLLLSLPLEKLDRMAVEARLRAIGVDA